MKGLFTALQKPSDEQIMWRVQKDGDAQSFSLLVERWQDSIRGVCGRLLGDPHRGEDLAQETFIRIYVNRAHYQPLARFSTYIWRIAINLCTDELRRRRRRLDSLGPIDPEMQESLIDNLPSREIPPDLSLIQEEQSALVRHALAKLTESHKTVLVLKHYEGLKFREIAEILEVPEGTVKSRMAEALTQLTRLFTLSQKTPSDKRQSAPDLTIFCL